jgi:hypothetical protein
MLKGRPCLLGMLNADQKHVASIQKNWGSKNYRNLAASTQRAYHNKYEIRKKTTGTLCFFQTNKKGIQKNQQIFVKIMCQQFHGASYGHTVNPAS